MKYQLLLEYAIKHKCRLKINKKGNYPFSIIPYSFDERMLYYLNLTYNSESRILLKNLDGCSFINSEDEQKYHFFILEKESGIKDLQNQLTNLKRYYTDILNKESNNCHNEKDKSNFEYKKSLFNQIFSNLRQNNLLFHYFSSIQPKYLDDDSKPIYLITQSNLSQKNAIKNALENHISVIEGPPGTGKTQSIISLIANCVIRNQKILVVSKNNSAIDNIIEKMERLAISRFYIRLGREEILNELKNHILSLINDYVKITMQYSELDNHNMNHIHQLLNKTSQIERRMNNVIQVKNELNEFENQMRFLEKRRKILDDNDLKIVASYIGNKKTEKELIRLLNFLVKISSRKEYNGKNNIIDLTILQKFFKIDYEFFKKYDVVIQWYLEKLFLDHHISLCKKEIRKYNLDDLMKQISKIYKEEYIKDSVEILKHSLKHFVMTESFKKSYSNLCQSSVKHIFKNNMEDIINIYPVIFTTVDAALYNFKNIDKKFDYVVIDESSQCDILSALPIMSMAKNLVVVGDSKQLQAITNIDISIQDYHISSEYNYMTETFLNSIKKVFSVTPTFLAEHYRCSYEIINYCNKYYYDNELIIYTNHDSHCMEIIDANKGKYVYIDEECSSFVNEREIVTINELVKQNYEDPFIITPFKGQAEHLKKQYNEKKVGTIHTFQGRENGKVYFSSVLNDLEMCKNHINGNHNLFYPELINVAVSRAINQFILVCDISFFDKMDCELKHLIDYIKVYGKEIPDKTSCIFDYLYKEIKTFKKTDLFDSVWEKRLKSDLDKYVENKDYLAFHMKQYMATVVSDKNYLNQNPTIKTYILNGAHIDYLFYDTRIGKPILAIELDGKEHNYKSRMVKDNWKNHALEHMGIKVLRISSKKAMSQNELFSILNKIFAVMI